MDLGVLAGKRSQPQTGLGNRLWPHGGDDVADLASAPPLVAARALHLVEPDGRQLGTVLQCLLDEGDAGIERRTPPAILPRLLALSTCAGNESSDDARGRRASMREVTDRVS